jgi:iron complex outermembrane receptor protein
VGNVPVRTNVALFYADFDGIPTTTYIRSPATGASVAVVQNNADAKRKGIELEATVMPFDGFTVDLSYSYLDAYYSKYDVAGLVVDRPQIFGAPEHKAVVAARYVLPIDAALGQVTVSAAGTYQSRFAIMSTPAVSPGLFQPGYSLLNLATDWNSVVGAPVDVSFFMTNVLDKEYTVGGAIAYSYPGFNFNTYGEPRMYGARLKYRF